MNEDLSNLLQNFNNAMNSDSSGDLKNMLSNYINSQENSSSDDASSSLNDDSINVENNDNSVNSNGSDSSNVSSDFNIDINTILQAKKIFDGLNSGKDDPRANLLLSLKPYLKDSRKDKIDKYVQLLKMGSILNILKENGDDNGPKF